MILQRRRPHVDSGSVRVHFIRPRATVGSRGDPAAGRAARTRVPRPDSSPRTAFRRPTRACRTVWPEKEVTAPEGSRVALLPATMLLSELIKADSQRQDKRSHFFLFVQRIVCIRVSQRKKTVSSPSRRGQSAKCRWLGRTQYDRIRTGWLWAASANKRLQAAKSSGFSNSARRATVRLSQ